MSLITPSGLAEASLHNYRQGRFHGEARRCRLRDLSEADASQMRSLYQAVSEVQKNASGVSPAEADPALGSRLAGRLRELTGVVSRGGEKSPSRLVRDVIHDATGGSLAVLMWTLDGGLIDADRRRTSRFLAIDHLKIMRNALVGLDDETRQLDLEGGLHGVGYVRDRWREARLRNSLGDVEVHFTGSGDTSFAENCFEFSTVQRVIYNLLSNACMHTADQRVEFQVSDTSNGAERSVQFVIANAVSPELGQRLSRLDDSVELFRPGFSTSGGGLGLGVCADLVQAAYGLPTMEQAIEEGYVGVELQGERLVSWFHWPRVDPKSAASLTPSGLTSVSS